jgi:hypothetical protein
MHGSGVGGDENTAGATGAAVGDTISSSEELARKRGRSLMLGAMFRRRDPHHTGLLVEADLKLMLSDLFRSEGLTGKETEFEVGKCLRAIARCKEDKQTANNPLQTTVSTNPAATAPVTSSTSHFSSMASSSSASCSEIIQGIETAVANEVMP